MLEIINHFMQIIIKKNFLRIYKMNWKITKETWGKCDIKTIEYYNTKEDILELWQKMRDVKIQTNHTNIDDVALKRIRKFCGKK